MYVCMKSSKCFFLKCACMSHTLFSLFYAGFRTSSSLLQWIPDIASTTLDSGHRAYI